MTSNGTVKSKKHWRDVGDSNIGLIWGIVPSLFQLLKNIKIIRKVARVLAK
jgi:hypothetical protein